MANNSVDLIGLVDVLRNDARYRHLQQQIDRDNTSHFTVIRAARAYFTAGLVRDWQGPVIYLTARGKRAYNIAEQLPVWLGDERPIHRFAEPTPMFYDRLPWDSAIIRERVETLSALLTAESAVQPIVVASARALMQRTLPPHTFMQRTFTLRTGERYAPDKLMQTLVNLGYEPVTLVIEPGTFSKRGGIMDVYPLAADAPVRIEWFDDEIDSLRKFEPATQRTIQTITQVTVIPAREALPDLLAAANERLQTWFESLDEQADDSIISITQDADALTAATAFPTIEHYLPYAYHHPVSLLDYVPDDALVIIEDSDELMQTVDELIEDAEANRENNIRTLQIPPDYPVPYVSGDLLESDLSTKTVVELSNRDLRAVDGELEPSPLTSLFNPGERFGGQIRPALRRMREIAREPASRAVIISEQIERLAELWQEQTGEKARIITALNDVPDTNTVYFMRGSLGEGWLLTGENESLALVTDAEIFNWSRPEPRRRQTSRRRASRAPESDYSDWNEGDYVVHVDYGIGQFVGLKHRIFEGTEREYLLIEYDGNDMVFVPIHQSDRLTRFVGPDDTPPKLSKLGKPEIWARQKDKAKRAAEDEARELLEIYARREAVTGHYYQPDTPWQHELEASFPFVETEDQLRVVREIKRDMESDIPMDRLVTGDVGYGKTEVALRAAFKAVMDGKQVAVLVPTTVLANQHFETFSSRMAPFPVRVGMLSRFRTRAEQNHLLKELREGKLDIVIGTHRLLSADVDIQSLGLIIIDEEQRFGVKHKEHFKKLRAQVDVLTLTATPIPRTLYMSLSGVRDISMIQTPPEERLPVITHVGAWNEKLARQAIMREVDRGGQIFVVHNRVRTIETVRERLEQLVPEASIVVGHGQMSSRQLERVISEFSHGQYDILLATSIIENGVDMPNVNTLIVDRADWFGMSQLYQIRGRVGRGAQQAYAYFFHAGTRKLTQEARARLETLAEHTNLGSGFQISVRDLELRGAGDILSMKQTGHVATVGLQLYTQLLQRAVARLKGEELPQASTISQERIIIDLPIPSYIPNDWIPEMALRLQLYRRIGNLETVEDLSILKDELRDRFGTLPAAVEGLMYQIHVKLLAARINATAIIKPRAHILVKLPWLAAVDRDALAASLGDDIEVSRTAVELAFDAETWQTRLLSILEELQQGLPQQITAEGIGE